MREEKERFLLLLKAVKIAHGFYTLGQYCTKFDLLYREDDQKVRAALILSYTYGDDIEQGPTDIFVRFRY
jgi:hypothetical protein